MAARIGSLQNAFAPLMRDLKLSRVLDVACENHEELQALEC